MGADVPSLGLSNKAVLEGDQSVPEVDKHVKDQYPDFYFKPDAYDKPPTEDTLVQNTLWPEIQKVKNQYTKKEQDGRKKVISWKQCIILKILGKNENIGKICKQTIT